MLRNVYNSKRILKFQQIFINNFTRHIFNIKHEYPATLFCKLLIESPFSIEVKPLDVHSTDSNKIIVKINENGEKLGAKIDFINNDNEIKMIGTSNAGVTIDNRIPICIIEAPIKTDLQLHMLGTANVILKYFCSDIITVNTDKGDIDMHGALSESVTLLSKNGNINCHSALQAKDINVKTSKDGIIKTQKLQGINLNLSTEKGLLQTDSCYCTNSKFETSSGELNLNNIHMNCEVKGNDIQKLNMSGIDGVLNVDINSCQDTMHFQISQLASNSQINVTSGGCIDLKIADIVQQNCDVAIIAKSVQCKNIDNMSIEHHDPIVTLKKYKNQEISDQKVTLFVNSEYSDVLISSASWEEMFKFRT